MSGLVHPDWEPYDITRVYGWPLYVVGGCAAIWFNWTLWIAVSRNTYTGRYHYGPMLKLGAPCGPVGDTASLEWAMVLAQDQCAHRPAEGLIAP